jgi:hypothetical protein
MAALANAFTISCLFIVRDSIPPRDTFCREKKQMRATYTPTAFSCSNRAARTNRGMK